MPERRPRSLREVGKPGELTDHSGSASGLRKLLIDAGVTPGKETGVRAKDRPDAPVPQKERGIEKS